MARFTSRAAAAGAEDTFRVRVRGSRVRKNSSQKTSMLAQGKTTKKRYDNKDILSQKDETKKGLNYHVNATQSIQRKSESTSKPKHKIYKKSKTINRSSRKLHRNAKSIARAAFAKFIRDALNLRKNWIT